MAYCPLWLRRAAACAACPPPCAPRRAAIAAVEAADESEAENFEELSYGSPEWALGIRKLWAVTPAHYTLELAAQTDFKCCRRCGLGWQLASATLRQVGDIDIDYLMSDEVTITDKTKIISQIKKLTANLK